MVIKLTKNAPPFKNNATRAKLFAAIKRFDNRPVDAFLEAATKKLRVLEKNRETESPRGRLRHVGRNEHMMIS